MIGEIYAIITAVLRGFSVIPLKKGLKHSTPSTSAIMYLMINTIMLWSITLYNHSLDLLLSDGFYFFVLAGFVAPGIATRFKDIGIARLGVTLSIPIVGSNTFFSMLLAITFLNEKLTYQIIIAAVLIFVGVNLITWQNENQSEWKKIDLIFPLAAALLYAISTNLRKLGLLKINDPIIGATITSTISLIILILSSQISRIRGTDSWEIRFNKQALIYFGFSGSILSIAFLTYFMALSSSFVIKIQPIAGTNPLFSIIFTYLFLKEEEKVTQYTILGTILVVLGIILITI